MKIKEFIKRHKLLAGFGVALVVLLTGTVFIITKPTLKLHMFDGMLVWKYNKGLKNEKFALYRNDDEILFSNQTKYRDNNSGDKSSPNKIESIDLVYKEDSIILSWKAPKDNGNTNVYKVVVRDNEGKIKASSKELVAESISGISGYEIVFNGKTYETVSTEFAIDISNIKEGAYDFKIVAKDKAGNLSEEYVENIEIYRPYLDGNEIKINSDKKYSFKAYSNGNSISVVNNKINKDELSDLTSPDKVANISVWNRGNKASIVWDAVKDNGTTHNVEIVGSTVSGDKAQGVSKIKGKASGVKGYYYAITNSNDYILSTKDKFTEETELLEVELPYEKNYLHIAAIDNSGNVSEVVVKRIDNSINESYVIKKVGDRVIIEDTNKEEDVENEEEIENQEDAQIKVEEEKNEA